MSEVVDKKTYKPTVIRFRQSTKDAIDRACHDEDRSLPYIVERAVRKHLGLDGPVIADKSAKE